MKSIDKKTQNIMTEIFDKLRENGIYFIFSCTKDGGEIFVNASGEYKELVYLLHMAKHAIDGHVLKKDSQ